MGDASRELARHEQLFNAARAHPTARKKLPNRYSRGSQFGFEDFAAFISAGSPWQNCYAERLIGTIRRECVDHLIVLGEAHLRRVVVEFAAYYNGARIHHSLGKDAPFHRAIERIGSITSRPTLGGLHHQYCRV